MSKYEVELRKPLKNKGRKDFEDFWLKIKKEIN